MTWPAGRIALALAAAAAVAAPAQRVGRTPGGALLPTGQVVRPAGETLETASRPVDMALTPDGRTLMVKDDRSLLVVDAARWQIRQSLALSDGASMQGVAISADGRRAWATGAGSLLHEAAPGPDGAWAWREPIAMPSAGAGGPAYPCGVAVARDGRTAWVALSRSNTLAVVDLVARRVAAQIPLGVAPCAVALSADERVAWVTNLGGRRALPGQPTAPSAGTPVAVDARGLAAGGTLSAVDLRARRCAAELAVGLQPCALALDSRANRLYVSNANSDTVSVVDMAARRVVRHFTVHGRSGQPYGSMPAALALLDGGRTLAVALAGENRVVGFRVAGSAAPRALWSLPTAWFPGALAAAGGQLLVANLKGLGSLGAAPAGTPPGRRRVQWALGVLQRALVPRGGGGAAAGAAAGRQGRPRATAPVPVPARTGEPSVFRHVIYVIKENRTYDQLFGDMAAGDGDPSLCIFGREITPNHHALAERFGLLDNAYCNGVNSADGHAWSVEGNVTPYLERAFGGFTRSYPFGDDPISPSSSGFIWDSALRAGLSVRNYGEMDYAATEPADLPFMAVYGAFAAGRPVRFRQSIGIERLRRISVRDYPGWNMRIPDVLRAERFIRDLRAAERTGEWPRLTLLYLPQDHTSGATPGMPTPRAHMADNDLALGRVVEAVSHSRFWPRTALFVVEDDPQDGFDHVDGHRSPCLAISAWSRRGAVVRQFVNQTAVLHTMARILGLPPMNQRVAEAPLMAGCFQSAPDLTPYRCLPNRTPLDELNPKAAALDAEGRRWALASAGMRLDRPDAIDDDLMNRTLWRLARGPGAPYPGHRAGAHGAGLAARGLATAAEREHE